MASNGNGWKLSMILGALLCSAMGLIVGAGTIYESHVRTSALESERAKEADATSISERTQLRVDISEAKESFREVKGQLDKIERVVSRLEERVCYMQTGRSCPSSGGM